MEWTQVFSENENLDSIICVIELKGIVFPVYYVNGMLITFTYYEITTSIIRSHTFPSRAPELTPGFWWVRVAHLFSFLCCPIMCLYVLSSVL